MVLQHNILLGSCETPIYSERNIILRGTNTMKFHVTKEDLSQLSQSQRLKLSYMWKPEMYDLAIGYVCIDAIDDKYQPYEFVVGDLEIYNRDNILLYDIRAIEDKTLEEDAKESDEASDFSEENSDDAYNDEENSEDNYETDDSSENFSDESSEHEADTTIDQLIRPSSFNKENCLPVLNIGQMIDLLQRLNFGNCEFFLTAEIEDFFCEIGKNNTTWNGFGTSSGQCELCDVLWEAIKALL